MVSARVRPRGRGAIAGALVALVFAAGLLSYVLRPSVGAPSRSPVPQLVNSVQVTSSIGVEYPAFSPDAEWLAYSSEESGNPDIWVLQLGAGQAVNRTTDNLGLDAWPSWSPDGRQIAFNSDDGGEPAIWMMDAFAGVPRRVASGGGDFATVPRDGTKLAYVKGRRISNLWRVPILEDRLATWTDAEQLTFDRARVNGFDLSPDGDRIVLSTDRSGTRDLWTMPADGGQLNQLTVGDTPEWVPAWSPEGQQIAFHGTRSGNRDIWIMPAVGGRARQLTVSDANDWQPEWRRSRYGRAQRLLPVAGERRRHLGGGPRL